MNYQASAPPDLELWGGVECTVNRIDDHYFDQLARSGHADRLDDLDRFAALGLRTLRYPLLWERIAPDGLEQADWRWADARMERLRTLGIRPIVGLVHHGSGPRQTSLLDPAFPARLAVFARAVAERYPWVDAYTPVNEPLTTARFTALYGHWYPHVRDERAFLLALLHQCLAVAQAMAEIRAVNPAASLIQTEDLGKTTSTPELAYQAEFDNRRRWLTFDLLNGWVDEHHPLWSYITGLGLDLDLLAALQAAPSPPDVLGLNYYVTGERFLDHRLDRYPTHTHGGNRRQAYADIEAVRVLAPGIAGPAALLREVWDRYRRPLAITEAHLGCTREEQMRWLLEVWHEAWALKRIGVDVRAVTVWSLLGAFDWDSLVTRDAGSYEPGVFDLRAPAPRPTALAGLVRDLATRQPPDHPLLDQPGWWRTDTRLRYPPIATDPTVPAISRAEPRRATPARSVLIVGTGDWLEHAVTAACDLRGIPHRVLRPEALDRLPQPEAVAWLDRQWGWAVIDLTSAEQFGDVPGEPTQSPRPSRRRAARLAEASQQLGLSLLTLSSDQVFAAGAAAHGEAAPVAPAGVMGQLYAAIERTVRQIAPNALIVRTHPIFGGQALAPFLARVTALAGTPPVAPDVPLPLTHAPDLVTAWLDVLIDGEQGVLHLAHPAPMPAGEIARQAAQALAAAVGDAHPPEDTAGLKPAPAPRRALLGSDRMMVMPEFPVALGRYLANAPAVPASSDQVRLARTGARR